MGRSIQRGLVVPHGISERISNLIRDGARPAVMLTPVDSFASAGIEVEIDAVAVRDRDRAEAVAAHGTAARRHGDIVFAVATAVCWLCSDEASYVTGAFMNVSGGRELFVRS